MPNFVIVENPKPNYADRFDEFVELYNDPTLLRREVREKLGWNRSTYCKARKEAMSLGLIQDSPVKPRYYFFNTTVGKWMVNRRDKNHDIRIRCESKEQAMAMVEYLHEFGWSKRNVKLFQTVVWPRMEMNNERTDR